jgi:hypothetical protein
MSLFWRSVRSLEASGRATRPIVRSLRYFHPKLQRFGVVPVVCFPIDDALARHISSFARLGGFVIRCGVRTLGFAYSSVAQR